MRRSAATRACASSAPPSSRLGLGLGLGLGVEPYIHRPTPHPTPHPAQGFAQLGSDLLVDFDLMMTIPILGPFFLTMTQLSMPWILRFLYTPEF